MPVQSGLRLPPSATLAALGAATATVLAFLSPLVATIAGAAVATTMLASPIGRLIVVLAGAIVVFQTSAGITAPKLAYVGILIASSIVAIARVRRLVIEDERYGPFRFLPILTVTLVIFLLGTSAIAARNDIPLADWSRDILPYLLLALAPSIGLDSAHACSKPLIVAVVVATAIAATLLFVLTWLARRNYALVEGGQFGLASMILCVLPFTYALVSAARPGRFRLLWACLALAIPVLLLATGTRTAIVMGGAIFGMIGSYRKARVDVSKVLLATAISSTMVLLVLPHATASLTGSDQFFHARFGNVATFFDGGAEATDQSFAQRRLAYSIAEETWKDHPILGAGPGHFYPNVEPSKPATLVLDSPVTTLAKFGLLGTIVLILFVAAVLRMIARVRITTGYTREITSARMAVIAVVALAPFSSPLDDKGFALMLMLMVALVASTIDKSPEDVAAVDVARTPQGIAPA